MLYKGAVRTNICYTKEVSGPIYVIQRRGSDQYMLYKRGRRPDQYMLYKGGVRINICYTKERSGPIYVIQGMGSDQYM